METDLASQLGAISIFRRLSPDDKARLSAVAKSRVYVRGDSIFREGEPATAFVAVITGRVKIAKATPSGKDIILEILGPGDPVGAVAVYEGRPYPASAIAIEETICIQLARDEFFALLERYPTLVRGLLAGLTLRLVDLTNRLAELTGGRVEPRVARLFLKLADEQGRRQPDGVFIPVALSRQELADMTGTTIETCIRIMSRWGKQDIVRTVKDGFVVLDSRELEALAMM